MKKMLVTILLASIVSFPLFQRKVGAAAPPTILGPYSTTTNHADDIDGVPDTRPVTWGKSGVNIHRYTFKPPAGYRVRILRVYGDFVAWVRTPGDRQHCAGVLWGLQTTAPEGSTFGDNMGDNGVAYLQHSTCGDPVRAPFDFDVSTAGLLEADNVLISKVATFCNDLGMIHMEPSFIIKFQYERVTQ